jgi:tRNA-uridine 2-sulfurtransferase
MNNTKLVYVMLSGGVDSSAAASTLLDQGYQVKGIFMKCWSLDQVQKMQLPIELYDCSWEDDMNDARLVAKKLGIEFEVWDLQQEYYDNVIQYMLDEYAIGRTPNPDVMCNGEIKFGVFYDRAMSLGADFVVTGHYARMGVNTTS